MCDEMTALFPALLFASIVAAVVLSFIPWTVRLRREAILRIKESAAAACGLRSWSRKQPVGTLESLSAAADGGGGRRRAPSIVRTAVTNRCVPHPITHSSIR